MNDINDIDNSFESGFGNSEIGNEGWNDPSDSIWMNIEKEIYPKEKKRFGYLFFTLSILLVLAFIFLGYLYKQNLMLKQMIKEESANNYRIATSEDDQKSRVENSISNKQQSAIAQDITESKRVDQPFQFKYTEQNETKIKVGESDIMNSSNEKKILVPNGKSIKDPFKESLFYDKSQVSQNAHIGSPIEKVENEKFVNGATMKPMLEPQGNAMPIVKDQLRDKIYVPLLTNDLEVIEYERQVDIRKTITIQKNITTRKSYLTILPQAAVGMLATKGIQETALTELIDKEYGNAGFGVDVSITKSISDNVDFSIGLGVESNSFSTEYDLTLPYNSEDEITDGNHAFIDFEHSLPTAFGNTDTALRLSRGRSTIINEPNVDLDFNTNHRFISLSLPIELKYRFGGESSFFTAGFTARPSYLLNASSSIQSVFSHHSGIDAINNKSESMYEEVRKFNLSLGVELGYHISISEKSGININLGFQDYLFDLYQTNNFSSSLQKIGLGIGYSYSL